MSMPNSTTHDETDILFDCSDQALAGRFGTRVAVLMLDKSETRDPYGFARLAASYAFQHAPELRGEPAAGTLGAHLFDLATRINRTYAEALRGIR